MSPSAENKSVPFLPFYLFLATGQLEKFMIEYDQYGRQVKRVDYTNHGYGDEEKPAEYHSDPHTHIYGYGPG